MIGFYPFVGFMLWPALSVAIAGNAHENVVRYAGMLADPSAQKLTRPIEQVLRALIVSPIDARAAEVALSWAAQSTLCRSDVRRQSLPKAELIQVDATHYFTVEVGPSSRLPVLFGELVITGNEVRHHQRFHARSLGISSRIFRRGM